MRRRVLIICVLTLCCLLIPTMSAAKPHKGFNTGPYLAVEVGASHNNYDRNQHIDQKVGTLFEPTVGFVFGWNLVDWFSTELQARYFTSEKNDRREHAAAANLNAKFFLITDALTNFKTLRILPFAKAGAAFQISVLPGDPSSTDDTVTGFGYGPSIGGGIMFLFYKYVYLGLNVQGNFLFFDDIRQDITQGGVTTPSTLIYGGGFIPTFLVSAILGVHF